MWYRFLLIGLIVFTTLAQRVDAAQVFKIATLAPDSTTWMREMRAGAAKIEQETEGRVKFKFYPGGVMGNDRAVLSKLRIGQLHGGAVTTGTLAGIFPDAQVYNLPFEFRSTEEVVFVRKQMDHKIAAGLERKGLILLGMSNGGFAYIASSNPIDGVSRLKEQRVWLPQGDIVGEAMFDAAEVSPVPLSLSDVYTALQTGLLNTIVANPSSIIAFQWHTKINYLTDAPVLFLMGTLVVDKRTFSKVSVEDQVVMRKVMHDVFARLDELNHADNLAALEALSVNGIKLVKVNGDERGNWDLFARKALDGLLKKGSYTIEYLNEMRGHIKAYREQAGPDA